MTSNRRKEGAPSLQAEGARNKKHGDIIPRRPAVRELEVRGKRIRIAGRYVFGSMALYAAMWVTAFAG